MNHHLRPARTEDLGRIRSFTSDTFTWGDYVADRFTEWLQDPDGLVVIAADAEDAPIGVARVVMLSGAEGWIHAARVDPQHQRQGVGMSINRHAVEWARQQGAQVVRLMIEESNGAAQAQVEKLGYRPVSRWAYSIRDLMVPSPKYNGGRRLAKGDQFDLAPSAEAEPAFIAWSASPLAQAAHGLFPVGWSWRKLVINDVLHSARQRRLWTCPAGWVMIEEEEDGLFMPWMVTGPDEVESAVDALLALGRELGAGQLRTQIPRLDWLNRAFESAGFDQVPTLIYEKGITG